ncbi:MAG: hypothetical protein ACK6DC_00265 [Planctomycetota bacterium]|jgi:hypothetical protein
MSSVAAKRILGGIAWVGAMLLTAPAWSQDRYLPPAAIPSSPSALPFQSGLSSKDYLRLMAEANEARGISAFPSPQAPPVQLASAPIPPAETMPSPTSPVPSSSLPVSPSENLPLPTSVHPFVQNGEIRAAEEAVVSASPSTMGGAAIADRSALARGNSPKLSVGYDTLWMRRAGDAGTSWSTGGGLGEFGEDRASQFRVGWYSNPMERYEFVSLGSLVWRRADEHVGPVDSVLLPSMSEPAWHESFQQSLQHQQSHTARLRSYALNKRWITDDLGNYFIGLQVIDYDEEYRLQTIDVDGAGAFGLSTNNLLAGLQGGLELWHPLSQRLSVGGQGILGLYGNFADGDWRVDVANAGGLVRSDRRFQTAASFGLDAKARYQLTSRLHAYGSYRWWYLAGMATVDDQTVGPLASDTPFAMSTDAGFLLQGAVIGLEIVF